MHPKYIVWLWTTKGVAVPQLWNGLQMNGQGQSKVVRIVSVHEAVPGSVVAMYCVEDEHKALSLDDLVKLYPAPEVPQ